LLPEFKEEIKSDMTDTKKLKLKKLSANVCKRISLYNSFNIVKAVINSN
jgi:hypothetical protein